MCQVILTKPVTICKIKLYIQCSTCRRINELTGIFKFENTKILSHYIHNIHSWKYEIMTDKMLSHSVFINIVLY